jgi:hypothetical protein
MDDVASSHVDMGSRICMPTHAPEYLSAFWLPIIAFEAVLCGLVMRKGQ